MPALMSVLPDSMMTTDESRKPTMIVEHPKRNVISVVDALFTLLISE